MKYIGIFNSVDWKSIIDSLGEGYNSPANLPDVSEITELKTKLVESKYNVNSIEWLNYYPNKDFDISVEKQFGEFAGYKPVRSWISCVRPGKTAPWHWDWHKDDDGLPKDLIKRLTCTISPSYPGQAFIVEKFIVYNDLVGATYEWNHYTDYHAGINASMQPKYQYNFVGLI
jgi:hypothetical protein